MECVVEDMPVEMTEDFVCDVVLATDVIEVKLEVVDVLVWEPDVLDLSSSSSSLSSSSSSSSRFSRLEYESICLSQSSSLDDIFRVRSFAGN